MNSKKVYMWCAFGIFATIFISTMSNHFTDLASHFEWTRGITTTFHWTLGNYPAGLVSAILVFITLGGRGDKPQGLVVTAAVFCIIFPPVGAVLLMIAAAKE